MCWKWICFWKFFLLPVYLKWHGCDKGGEGVICLKIVWQDMYMAPSFFSGIRVRLRVSMVITLISVISSVRRNFYPLYKNRLAKSLMLPTIFSCSLTPHTATYFESCLKKLLIKVLNVIQHSIKLVLFELLLEFRGYLKDWIERSWKLESFWRLHALPLEGTDV